MTTLPHQDPEAPAIYDIRKRRIDHLWLDGSIGDATYLRSLFIYGYLPDVANSELNLLRMEKQERSRR